MKTAGMLLIILAVGLFAQGVQMHYIAGSPMDLSGASAVKVPTATPGDNTTNAASTAFIKASITALGLGTASTQAATLRATTTAITGTITGVGSCLSPTTVTVTGATTGMVVQATPVTDPGSGASWPAWVSSANTVSVRVCSALATLALTSSAYNVAVIP